MTTITRASTIAEPSPTETDPTWAKPGPGSWVLDRDHTGPTPSRPVRDLFTEAAAAGMAEAFALLGGPLATMRVEFVNGRFYRRLVPAVAGDRDGAPPPAAALWIGARVHPTLRARERTARRALAGRTWLDELARWESEWRPGLVARNLELTRVDVADLDDAGLAHHLDEIWAHLRWSTALHFRLHGTDVGPIGLLLARTDALGIERRLVFDALAGASPATNAPAEALARLRGRITETAGADDPPTSLRAIRDLGAGIAEEVDDFVDRYGWRITTGYDFTDRTLVELPGVIESALTAGSASVPGDDVQMGAERRGKVAQQRLLDAVPAEDRDEIAQSLDDARRCYGLRDENGPLTYEWPAGVMRRALRTAGERLADRSAIAHASHVFDATVDETSALLRGSAAPTSAELARRHHIRSSWRALDPPETLGPEERIPPAWTLPRGMRLLTSATLIAFELLGADHGAAPTRALHGTGIGDTPFTGTARVVDDAVDAFDRVEPGDVLVVTATVPTFNAVLALAGAVVVEEGGLLSHAAVMARELGFAAVIGAKGATTEIADGVTVEVDPVQGVVRVLD